MRYIKRGGFRMRNVDGASLPFRQFGIKRGINGNHILFLG